MCTHDISREFTSSYLTGLHKRKGSRVDGLAESFTPAEAHLLGGNSSPEVAAPTQYPSQHST